MKFLVLMRLPSWNSKSNLEKMPKSKSTQLNWIFTGPTFFLHVQEEMSQVYGKRKPNKMSWDCLISSNNNDGKQREKHTRVEDVENNTGKFQCNYSLFSFPPFSRVEPKQIQQTRTIVNWDRILRILKVCVLCLMAKPCLLSHREGEIQLDLMAFPVSPSSFTTSFKFQFFFCVLSLTSQPHGSLSFHRQRAQIIILFSRDNWISSESQQFCSINHLSPPRLSCQHDGFWVTLTSSEKITIFSPIQLSKLNRSSSLTKKEVQVSTNLFPFNFSSFPLNSRGKVRPEEKERAQELTFSLWKWWNRRNSMRFFGWNEQAEIIFSSQRNSHQNRINRHTSRQFAPNHPTHMLDQLIWAFLTGLSKWPHSRCASVLSRHEQCADFSGKSLLAAEQGKFQKKNQFVQQSVIFNVISSVESNRECLVIRQEWDNCWKVWRCVEFR